ncbi:MAG TPA: response regulator [Chitinophagaceae bacterium]|nr:response regulator [Chitinophagaceae bacterium]
MKKFYILFLSIPVVIFCLAYLSAWWSVGAVAAIMLFIASRFYTMRLQTLESRNNILERELEDLHGRLEQSVQREEKMSKEASQAKKQRQQLLSVISHEVRTPMNGILGTALLVEDTPLTNEQQQYMHTIRHCGESMLTTINNILANDVLQSSRLQQEENQLEYKDFDLRDSVEEVLELFAGKAAETALELIYQVDEDVPVQLIGDSKRLRQVLMNLVENAVKFTHRGEVFVGIHRTDHGIAGYPPELRFEVRDTGIGIESRQLAQLFKGIPGKELPRAEGAASGLGLVVCRKLVELMGGRIEAKSIHGQGSVFTFHIPVTPSLKTVRNQSHQQASDKLEGKQILIVDDNESVRTTLMARVKQWNMRAFAAASATEALQLLSANSFDLVLTDISMPQISGLQLAQIIKERYAGLKVLAMNNGNTGYNGYEQLFLGVVPKPVKQHILKDKIAAALTSAGSGAAAASTTLAEQYPLRILVAEDNLVNQKIAIKILAKLGYEASLANNGKDALEIVSHEQFDIILMDVQMPEMDGLEATRMIRTCLQVQPVIIALTANTMQGDRDECIQAGMDDYLSKPIQMQELVAQLEKWGAVVREKRKIAS